MLRSETFETTLVLCVCETFWAFCDRHAISKLMVYPENVGQSVIRHYVTKKLHLEEQATGPTSLPFAESCAFIKNFIHIKHRQLITIHHFTQQ